MDHVMYCCRMISRLAMLLAAFLYKFNETLTKYKQTCSIIPLTERLIRAIAKRGGRAGDVPRGLPGGVFD